MSMGVLLGLPVRRNSGPQPGRRLLCTVARPCMDLPRRCKIVPLRLRVWSEQKTPDVRRSEVYPLPPRVNFLKIAFHGVCTQLDSSHTRLRTKVRIRFRTKRVLGV